MSKRKREDEAEVSQSQQLRHQVPFRASFGQHVNNLTDALKLARGFERQKLGRRQKQASDKPKSLLRLREEVIVLKQLDLEKTARNHLLKHLSKIKRIRECPIFIRAVGDSPKVPSVKPGAEANVIGLLFKSAPVRATVENIVNATYADLGLTKEKPHPSSKHSERALDSTPNEKFLPLSEQSTSLVPAADDERGDRLEANRSRLAQSDEDDADSFASFETESMTGFSPSPPVPEPTSTTAFLPVLGMAGYYSGSDSEASDIDNAEPELRKNRRGQRARQQLAELKYGRNAKHLQKSQGEKGRDAGWDAKRGAVGSGTHPRSRVIGGRSFSGQDSFRHDNLRQNDIATRKEKPKTRDDGGPIHPSWEAAKLRKQLSGGQVAFIGKKITFD